MIASLLSPGLVMAGFGWIFLWVLLRIALFLGERFDLSVSPDLYGVSVFMLRTILLTTAGATLAFVIFSTVFSYAFHSDNALLLNAFCSAAYLMSGFITNLPFVPLRFGLRIFLPAQLLLAPLLLITIFQKRSDALGILIGLLGFGLLWWLSLADRKRLV